MSETGDTVVTEALASVIRDHGWRVAADPARLRASISDLLGSSADDHRGLVDALVVSAEEGTARTIRETGREDMPQRSAELATALETWGLTAERASWVVAAWTGLLPGRTDVPPDTAVPRPPATELPPPPHGHTPPGGSVHESAGASPTELPPPPVRSQPPRSSTSNAGRRAPGRRTWVLAGAALVLVAGGTGIALAVSHRDDATGHRDPGGSSQAPAAGKPLSSGHVVSAPKADPKRASRRAVMAGRDGGVQLRAFEPVTSVGRGRSAVLPAQGGTLVAFTLADWCPVSPCTRWQRLGLHVAVGGTSRALPPGGPTFVVSVPRGGKDVSLVLPGRGGGQTLSLLDGRPGADNITVLTRRLTLRKTTGAADSLATTRLRSGPLLSFSYGFGSLATVKRHVVVQSAQLGYFGGALTPTKPGDALLYLHAYYDYGAYGYSTHNLLQRDEVHFQPAGGAAVAPLTDPVPGHDGTAVYVFEVPGGITTGSFIVGGHDLGRVISTAQATSGVPSGSHYTLSLTTARIPVHLP